MITEGTEENKEFLCVVNSNELSVKFQEINLLDHFSSQYLVRLILQKNIYGDTLGHVTRNSCFAFLSIRWIYQCKIFITS